MSLLNRFLKTVWNHYAVQWVVRTAYYLIILILLIYIYGFVDQSPEVNFIYNGF